MITHESITAESPAAATVVQLELGIKSDPVEYRYSYEWLFRLAAEEGVRHIQLGSFFEMYQLPDAYFRQLRTRAEDAGVQISSLFTAHRELGGFFRDDGPGWVDVARRNFERLIQIAALLGAQSVGSNPGAVLRDRIGTKAAGIRTYLTHCKELMHIAHDLGIQWLTIEPMSCLAEPPTLPEEIRAMCQELSDYHAAHAESTCRPGLCLDVSHGYADLAGKPVHEPAELIAAGLPWCSELHLKNTDARFHSTFGFSDAERSRGIVDIDTIVQLLHTHAEALPQRNLIAYLEIGGPKLGRDYSDCELENQLRTSLRYLKEKLTTPPRAETRRTQKTDFIEIPAPQPPLADKVIIAPSIMCADQCHLEESIRRLERAGASWLHFDLMDMHFTPNMPMGLVQLSQLRGLTMLPYDAHLMVSEPDPLIRELAKVGTQYCSVHAEACRHLDRTLSLIRDQGIKAGVALNPATPLSVLDYVLDRLDFVLIMTVNPGFAGQKIVPAAIRKITDCRMYLDRAQPHRRIPIEVDGNVSFDHISDMVAAGGDILVAGTSSIFHPAQSIKDNIADMHKQIADGIVRRGTSVAVFRSEV